MTILNMARFGRFQIAIGSDQVIGAVPIPAGGSLLQCQGSIHWQTTARLDIEEVIRYGIVGYLIPVPDFNTALTYKALWDRMVPKDDTATDTIDMDEAAGDTAPEDEPGDPDIEKILGLTGSRLPRVFRHRKWVSFATHQMGFEADTTWFYRPSGVVPVNINSRVFAEEPSMLMLAFTAPTLDITTSTLRSTPSQQDWARMADIEDTLDDMRKNALALTEAGATTPYVEAQVMMVDLLEQAVMEEAAAADDLLATAYNVMASLNFKVDMPERGAQGEITAG